MSARDQLAELGWCISEEGLELLSENGQIQDIQTLARRALDFDLRDIGDAGFPEDFTKEPSKLERPIVVQIQKIRNVSAPKVNEESKHAPRMLKLTLNDGKSSCTAVEINPISNLSINTPPGTKVLLKNEDLKVQHGIIWLEPIVISVLGGKVTHMIEKWELNRSLAKHTRGGPGGADGGPPPWIPFGQHLDPQAQDKPFRSLLEASKQDNAEFEAQRKGAIAEAQRLSGIKKVFGGGTKPLLDANVQRIVDAGFIEEQAENALKYAKNNVDRALRILQRRDGPEPTKKEKPQKEEEKLQPKRKGRNKEVNDDDVVPVKPSGKVSLFDFLEDKLPNVPDKEKSRPPTSNTKEERSDRSYGGRERNNTKTNFRPQGNRFDSNNKYRSESSHNSRNYAHDNQYPTSSNGRDDRKYQTHTQNEKPPRFQKKIEENNKRQNVHNNFDTYNSSTYQGQPSNQYSGRTDRSSDNKQRQTVGQSPVDNLTDATANLSLVSNSQIKPNENSNLPRGYQNNPEQNYPSKQTYSNNTLQGSVGPDGMSYRRNNAMPSEPKYQDTYRRNQMNGYMDPMYSGLNYIPNQQSGYQNGRQGYGYGQQRQMVSESYGGGGGGARSGPSARPPAYLGNNIVAFQNPAVNEQARTVLGGGDVQWNVGDRCLALYWEDNNFYEAEITGISANTVVVKFCAYGNHEEILKTNCLPYPNQGNSGYRAPTALYAPRRP